LEQDAALLLELPPAPFAPSLLEPAPVEHPPQVIPSAIAIAKTADWIFMAVNLPRAIGGVIVFN
jgi:hypothetical protein